MLDERPRRLARNLAIALVLAGCSTAQYAAVSKAATFRVVLAGDSIVELRAAHTRPHRWPRVRGAAGAPVTRPARERAGLHPGSRCPRTPRPSPRAPTGPSSTRARGTSRAPSARPPVRSVPTASRAARRRTTASSATLSADRVGLLYGTAPGRRPLHARARPAQAARERSGTSAGHAGEVASCSDALDRLRISHITGGVTRVAGLMVRREHDDVENQVGAAARRLRTVSRRRIVRRSPRSNRTSRS